jgi:hypothetical protein
VQRPSCSPPGLGGYTLSHTHYDASHYRGALRRTRVHAEYDDEFFTWISRAGNSDKVCTITPTDSRSTKDKQIMANLPPDITQNGDGPEAGSYH